MSGRKLLLDSNIVIYLAKKQLQPEAFLKADDMLFISDITFMETLGYAFVDTIENQETQNLISILLRTPIDETIVQKVIAVRQNYKMKLPDAIIAATALVHDCILVTRNISDFSGLPGLTVLNPFEVQES
jgi:predicted nucleic acid-binding protein